MYSVLQSPARASRRLSTRIIFCEAVVERVGIQRLEGPTDGQAEFQATANRTTAIDA